jgi:hypothetical protein
MTKRIAQAILAAFVALLAVAALSLTTSCTTPQKQRLWTAIERATRDKDAPPPEPTPPPVVTPAPAPPTPAPCQTWPDPPATMRGGGVWKPVSESDHKLVILINTRFRGHVTRLALYRAGSNELLEEGRFVGDTHNGCRPHFRFSKPGSGYGADIVIRVTVRDGTWRDHHIPDGARRWDW